MRTDRDREESARLLLDLRERIALSTEFSPLERDLILDAMALRNQSGRHEYPPAYQPGSSPAVTLVWGILDQLPPDAMSRTHRFMLAGMILGAIKDLCEQAGVTMEMKQ